MNLEDSIKEFQDVADQRHNEERELEQRIQDPSISFDEWRTRREI